MESKQKELIHQEIEKKIDDLLQKMTLKEKIGQMTQQGPSLVGGFDLENLIGKFANGEISSKEFEEIQKQFSENLHEDLIEAGEIGSFLGASGAEKINRLQKIAVEKSRLGIPLLFGMDVIHGYRTIFPTPLAESCCWDLSLMEKSARIAAKEASADGIRWTFSPMVDICRDARWGRICEGGGEDSYLTSEIAKAKVHGYQTDDVSKPDSIAACAK
ncbi:MAG: glycosyl hydrolase, partial [Oscillospiraceae bacterium]|nr:glycosyl hydrolase [Oscillospiraceae bacterium]